jgi:hypothetical protein
VLDVACEMTRLVTGLKKYTGTFLEEKKIKNK